MRVSELFVSIQGEGKFIGWPAIFIRTYGCVPPYCDFCDTKYSWQGNGFKELGVDQIIETIADINTDFVVISGGEPYAQPDIYNLINKLLKNDYHVQMETSGKAPILEKTISDRFTIIMSPKQYDNKIKIDDSSVHMADYFKFVIKTRQEFETVRTFMKDYNIGTEQVYLMPEGQSRQEQLENSKLVIELCKAHNMMYSPRLHVLLWDLKRGV